MFCAILLYFLIAICSISNKSFDISYINLASEQVRKNHMETILSRAGCLYSRFNAVNGRDLGKGKIKIKDYTRPLNLKNIQIPDYKDLSDEFMGMVGCKLSHYINFRKIEKTRNDKPVLILEDDVDLEENFVDEIENALNNMPENWDILLVSPYFTFEENSIEQNPSISNKNNYFKEKIIRVKNFFETSGFIINGWKAAQKIADMILSENKENKKVPIDLFLSGLSGDKRIIVYALKEKLVIQLTSVFDSSIPTSQKIPQDTLKKSISKIINCQN